MVSKIIQIKYELTCRKKEHTYLIVIAENAKIVIECKGEKNEKKFTPFGNQNFIHFSILFHFRRMGRRRLCGFGYG